MKMSSPIYKLLSDKDINPDNVSSLRRRDIENQTTIFDLAGLSEKKTYLKGKNSLAPDTNEKYSLFVKNMVSIRCKMIVKAVMENLAIPFAAVELGEIETTTPLTTEKTEALKIALLKFGLELIENKKNILVEKIKNVIVEMIHYEDELPRIKFSDYLTEKLKHNYTYLSNLFSEIKGTTIEHFILVHKIERVKELIVYDELTLSEIAWKLQYSSVAHLSSQFKNITGLTPTHFKNMKHKRRIALENL